jgi:transposase
MATKYSREFKIEAVRLAAMSDGSTAAVARELGINPNLLYRWRQELAAEGQEAFPGQGNLKASEEEVRQLRRELARVREERDILKKAVAFFAKESK